MQQRKQSKQTVSLDKRLAEEALRLRALAQALGIRRAWLLRRARQCETAYGGGAQKD